MNSAKSRNQSCLLSHEFPIHAAASGGCPQTLIGAIAACSWRDVYSIDQLGRTPLHLAAAAGAAASVAILTHPAMLQLQHGVVGNALDALDRESRWTALHCAAYSGRLQIISMLLKAGADPSIRDSDGMTPWDILGASQVGYCHSDVALELKLPPKVCWFSSKKSDAFSFGLTSNYCLGYDSGCHVVSNPRPVALPSASDLHSVACSCSLSLFVTTDGNVYACGLGDHNQLMMSVPFCVEPVQLSRLPPKVVSVAIGKRHCLSLTDSGDVYGWGSNDRCQLGSSHGVKHQHLSPVKIVSGIAAISAGFAHSAAVSSGGDTLFVWGDNCACQCSQPSACSIVRTPAAARMPSGLRVTTVSCGLHHTAFVASFSGEPPTAFVFGAGSAAATHLLLLPALSQLHWHLMPDCQVGAIAAGDDWTAVVTLVSQRCYVWRHCGGHAASPSIVSLARHVRVCRITAAPSRFVLLLSDNTIVSVPVYKRPSDRVIGTPETLCRMVGCSDIAASDGTCLLVCKSSLLCDDGMWRTVAESSSFSQHLPLQRICEVALCSTLTSTLAPSALELALSIGAPVLAVAAAFACLMDPIFTCSCSLSELAWGLLESALSRLKLLRSESLVPSTDRLPLVQAMAKDLIDDWGELALKLIESEGARASSGSWEGSIHRLAVQSKAKQKQRTSHFPDSKSRGSCLDSNASPSTITSPKLLSQNKEIGPSREKDAVESLVAPKSGIDVPKSLAAFSQSSIQSEQFPPLVLHVQKGSSTRLPRQKRDYQVQSPESQPCAFPLTPLSKSLAAPCFPLDPQQFPSLLDAAVSPPPTTSNQVTPKTKSKPARLDSSAPNAHANAQLPVMASESHAELQRVAIPDASKIATSSRKKHRQKCRHDPGAKTGLSLLTDFSSTIDLSASANLKGWSAASETAAAAPLTSIMREEQEMKHKKNRERIQLRDSVWQQARA
jgi:hypothetical protein